MITRRIAFVVVAVVLALASSAIAQSADPFIGTWQLNPAKSKYTPGPVPKSGTTKIEAAGTGYKFTVHQDTGTGPAQDWTLTSAIDGKPAKVNGTNSNADTIAYKRIDARTLESVQMKGSKETQRQRIVISADGKTRTVTSTGVDGSGKKINNVAVYEKK